MSYFLIIHKQNKRDEMRSKSSGISKTEVQRKLPLVLYDYIDKVGFLGRRRDVREFGT